MTHSNSISDDQISAWLDGELDSTEAAVVKKAIDTDPSVAQRVGEMRVLSRIFQSLPVEPVPRGFHDLIIQATQKAVHEPATTVRPTRTTSPRKRWWVPAGLIASVAGLIVAVNLRGPDNTERLVAESSADSATQKTLADEMTSASMGMAFDEASAGDGLGDPEGIAVAPKLDASQLEFKRSLVDVDVGDVVEAIDQSGDMVSVVKLTVVDRNASVGRLEVLLAVHGGTTSARGGMIMVEATPTQVAECFKTLQQEDLCENILVASNSVDYEDVSYQPSQSKESDSLPVAMAEAGGGYGGAANAYGVAADGVAAGGMGAGGMAPGADVARTRISPKSMAGLNARSEEEQDAEKAMRPVRVLIVLEPSEPVTGEGSGSIVDFQAIYGCIG